MSDEYVLRGGWVVDPSSNLDARADVRIRGGRVAAIGMLDRLPGERVVEVDGLVVAPGLIDVHVHLREPGQEWKETIASGSAAAAAGGFSTVFCMPNTEPALDSVAALEELRRRTDRDALVKIRPIAAISEGRRGRLPVDYEALATAGAVGFSDDGDTTSDAEIMREALTASGRLGLPVMVHCEDPTLTGGAMHGGDISQELGIPGLPAAAEETIISRDLALAAMTGGWLHVCHVSTAAGAELIAGAKANGFHVTAEAMPHHLVLTDDWVAGDRTLANAEERPCGGPELDRNTKVNPPLRPKPDAVGLLHWLRSGAIDLVATDHAPHARPEKDGRPYETAAFGMTGCETALPLMLALVRAGHISTSDAVWFLSAVPARFWGIDAGTLRPGAAADIVVFDPNEEWTAEEDRLVSRSANTPVLGMPLRGRVKLTIVSGEERHRDW